MNRVWIVLLLCAGLIGCGSRVLVVDGAADGGVLDVPGDSRASDGTTTDRDVGTIQALTS